MSEGMPSDNPFAALDPAVAGDLGAQHSPEATPATAAPPPGPSPFTPDNPFAAENPFPDHAGPLQPPEPESSGVGSFIHSAERGLAPALAGVAAFGRGAVPGARLGASIGAFGGPVAEYTVPIGGFIGGAIGGLGAMFGTSYAVDKAQDYALSKAPDSFVDALGQSDEQRKADEEKHPMASFLGGLAPYALTMRPGGFARAALPENATTLQRLMANPITAKLFGGTVMGGMELGQEKVHGLPTNWPRVGIAFGQGVVFDKPTRLGEWLHGMPSAVAPEAAPAVNAAEPTVAQAADAKVMGPGITEDVFHGSQEQHPEAEATAQENARQEAALTGTAAPEPDLHVIARRMHPELFEQYDALDAQREQFRRTIADSVNPPDDVIAEATAKRDALQEQLADVPTSGAGRNLPEARRIRAQIRMAESDLNALNERRAAFSDGRAVETPEASAARQHLLAVDYQMRDLSPEVAAAYRRASDAAASGHLPAAPLPEESPAEPAPFRSMAEMLAARDGKAEKTGTLDTAPEPAPAAALAPVEATAEPAPAPAGTTEAAPAPPIEENAPPSATEPAPAPQQPPTIPVPPAGPSPFDIAADVARRLIAAGRPEVEANALGALWAARYKTRAARFRGVFGTAEDLYRREGHAIRGPDGRMLTPPAPDQIAKSPEGAVAKSPEPPPTPGVYGTDQLPAWIEASKFSSIDEMHEQSTPNQEALSNLATRVADDVGASWKNPGIKAKDLAAGKMVRKLYPTLGHMTDLVRGGFTVKTPGESDAIISKIAEKYPVIDEGWNVTPAGYMDRKALVRFANGQIGELQFWHQDLLDAKGKGGGHALYDEWRVLPLDDPHRAVLAAKMQDLYGRTLDQLPPEWNALTGRGGQAGNLASQAPGVSTLADMPTSASSTRVQEPDTNAQASPGVQNAGRPSQEQGLGTGLAIDPPSVSNLSHGLATRNTASAENAHAVEVLAEKANELSPAEQRKEIPAYSKAADEAKPATPDKPAGLFLYDPRELNVDADRFQFKSGGDEYGVTGALRSVSKWDPSKANTIMVWEQADGKLFVADGHQRSGLARRLTAEGKATDIQLPGLLFRETDGFTSDKVRALAASANIANGSGSAIDGAKVLRSHPELMDGSLPLSSGKGDQAAALARLGDEPFRMVVNKVVPENFGAIVGQIIPRDEARQTAAIKAIARFEPKNVDEASVLTQRVAQAELAKADEGRQTSMFGDLETEESTAGEEMKIVGRAIKDLQKDKALFTRVLANASRIEETGSTIERDTAQGVASDAAVFARTLASDAYTAGPVREALKAAARDLKDGKASIGEAAGRIHAALRRGSEEHVGDGVGLRPREQQETEGAESEKALELAQEPGAEGLPQTLIPGVEPITDRDRIQVEANRGLTGGNAAPPEGGLFDEDARNQQDLFQNAQGKIRLSEGRRSIITLTADANASTFIHETGHQWLEDMLTDAEHPAAPEDVKADAQTVRNWLGNDGGNIKVKQHEKFARGFEQYMREGRAPTPELADVFRQFRDWLVGIYRNLRSLGAPINDDVRGVFDRLLSTEPNRTIIAPEREGGPTLGDIHAADAAEIEPHEAEGGRDRIKAESERAIADAHPEVLREIEAAHQAQAEAKAEAAGRDAAGGAGPAGQAGDGSERRGQVDGAGEQPEPVAGSGGPGASAASEREGGADTQPEGDGLRGSGATGSADASRSTEHPLAPRPAAGLRPEQSRFVDKAGNIRVDNLTTREDVAQAIHDAADANNDFIGQRRGVVTDGQVMDLADALGMSPDILFKRRVGQAFNAEQVMAARKLLVQSATDLTDIMRRAATGTDEDVLAYAQAKDRHQMIQAQVAGITAEAGRALRAFRDISMGEDAQQADLFVRQATGKTLFQLKEEAKLGAALQTPEQVSKFMNDARKPSFGRMLNEYFVNNLISGPVTHVTYSIGNTLLTANRMLFEQPAAAAFGAIRRALGGEGGARIGEVAGMARGAGEGLMPAVQAAIDSYRTGATTMLPGEGGATVLPFQFNDLIQPAMLDEHANLFSIVRGLRDGIVAAGGMVKAGAADLATGSRNTPGVSLRYQPGGAIPDIEFRGVNVLPLGSIARFPSRNVAAIHSFFRSLNYSIDKSGQAYRMAANEGLEGNAFATRVGDVITNPDERVMEKARGSATNLTLMSQGGTFINNLSKLLSTEIHLPGLGATQPLRFIDPFVKIAGNVMNQSLMQRSPIGLFSPEIRADLAGRNGEDARDLAVGRMMVGTSLAVTFGTLAAQGLISGSGPIGKDAQDTAHLQAMWRLAGNQAYSVRIGDTWYDMHRLGPLGMLMGISADMTEVAHLASSAQLTEAAAALQHAFVQNILDESFMRGPADLIKAVEDPGRYGSGYIRNFLTSFVPYSVALGQMDRASDPYSRQARTIMDGIKAKIPGLSESLYPRRDIWGEPIQNRDALVSPYATAIYASHIGNDPVNRAMLEIGAHPAPVEKKIRGVQLDAGQYDDFARIAGRMTKLNLNRIVGSQEWRAWPAHIKLDVVNEVVKQSRESASGIMMMKYPAIVKAATAAKISKVTGAPTP